MSESLNQIINEINLEKLHNNSLDKQFEENQARILSSKLAKVSKVLISLWELTAIIMKLKPGESIVIDGDSGDMFRGRVKTAKLQKMAEKVAGRTSLEIDSQGFHEYLVTRSSVFSPGNPLKHTWEMHIKKAPKICGNPVVEIFEELLAQNKRKITKKFTSNSLGHNYVEISMEGIDIIIGINLNTNKVHYYISGGKKTEI